MPNTVNDTPPLSLRVFLASPGDVADERARALDTLEQLAYEPFLRGRISIEAVAWDKEGADTPMLASMTPQEAISLQRPKPSDCDVVVVIFWSRMGTPLPADYRKEDGTPYLSGTEWEYLDALKASRDQGRPAVLVYRRKEVPTLALDLDDVEREEKLRQWKLVEDFFLSFTSADQSQSGGYNEYVTPDAFEKKLSAHLKEIFHQLLIAHEKRAGSLTTSKPTSTSAAEASPPSAPELWQGSPFPGLRAFKSEDAPIYFGRGRETDGLIRRLAAQQRFIAVVGASGSGKSSLVAAGLLPRLAANALPGSRDWVVLRMTPGGQSDDDPPGDNPFAALAAALETALEPGQRRLRDEASKLREDTHYLGRQVERVLAGLPEWAEVLLFIDQFEELFTVVGSGYRSDFADLLQAAAQLPRLRIVLTVRADFFHHCVEQQALTGLLQSGTYPLAAPDAAALEEMITRPAARAGLHYDEGLPERIRADVGGEPGALPLLAFALLQLYEAGQSGGGLTATAYDKFGGVKGAISERAETVFKQLDTAAQATLPSVFRGLIEVEETATGWVATRKRASLEALTADPSARQLVDAFRAARLLVSDEAAEQPIVEVAHEALLRQWPRLRDWVAVTGKDLQNLRLSESAAAQWHSDKKPDDQLWPRRRCKEAEQVMVRLNYSPEDRLAEFLGASRRRSLTRSIYSAATVVVLASTLAFVGWLSYESIYVDDAWPLAKVRLGIDYREPEMVLIEPGEFLMGSPKGEVSGVNDEVQHPVKINKPFEVSRYEVTFDQYDLFVKATKRPRQEYKQGFISGSHPVVLVSWNDAVAYAQWLSEVSGKDYRLPTEAEWEYVARACPGGLSAPCQGHKYWWGDDLESIKVDGRVAANCDGCGSPYDNKSTAPVDDRAFRPNAFGLYHTAGNVWEWTCSEYSKIYDGAEQGCLDQEAAGYPVLRGGSWYDLPDVVRSAFRSRYGPGYRDFTFGFRLARSL